MCFIRHADAECAVTTTSPSRGICTPHPTHLKCCRAPCSGEHNTPSHPFRCLRVSCCRAWCQCAVPSHPPIQADSIAARRESLELELQQELETSEAADLSATASSADEAAPTTTGSPTHVSPEAGDGATEAEPLENGPKKAGSDANEGMVEVKSESEDVGNDDALAEEQRRLEEIDKAEYEAEMAKMKK